MRNQTQENREAAQKLLDGLVEAAKARFGEDEVSSGDFGARIAGWKFRFMYHGGYPSKVTGLSGADYGGGKTRVMIRKDGSVSYDKALDKIQASLDEKTRAREQHKEREERKEALKEAFLASVEEGYSVENRFGAYYKVKHRDTLDVCDVTLGTTCVKVSNHHVSFDVLVTQVWDAVRLVNETSRRIRELQG